MPRPSELTRLPPKILIFGPAGSGKTALTATLGDRLQLLDLERGWTTALTMRDKFTEERAKIDVVECYEEPPQFGGAHDKLVAHISKVQKEIAAGTYKYKALGIDTLTSWVSSIVRKVGKSAQMRIQDWGEIIREVEMVLAAVRALPIIVILNCHDELFEVKKGELVIDVRTQISVPTKKLPSNIPVYFDEVWYARVAPKGGGVNEYVLQTVQEPHLIARSRGQLPNKTKSDEGMPELLKKIGYTL